LPQHAELLKYNSIIHAGKFRLGQNHKINVGESIVMTTETFPDQTLDPVPVDRAFQDALGNSQPQAWAGTGIGPGPGQKPLHVGATMTATLKQALKLLRTCQAHMTRKPAQGQTGAGQGIRRLRPLARRAFSTLRPFAVDMRARNPCVRARWSLLGWNVLFMAVSRKLQSGNCFKAMFQRKD